MQNPPCTICGTMILDHIVLKTQKHEDTFCALCTSEIVKFAEISELDAWSQSWEESERGWGVSLCGISIHKTKEDILSYLKDIRDEEAKYYHGTVPDTYIRPHGEPIQIKLKSKELIVALLVSKHGFHVDESLEKLL